MAESELRRAYPMASLASVERGIDLAVEQALRELVLEHSQR